MNNKSDHDSKSKAASAPKGTATDGNKRPGGKAGETNKEQEKDATSRSLLEQVNKQSGSVQR